jgi:hypothetical protein
MCAKISGLRARLGRSDCKFVGVENQGHQLELRAWRVIWNPNDGALNDEP